MGVELQQGNARANTNASPQEKNKDAKPDFPSNSGKQSITEDEKAANTVILASTWYIICICVCAVLNHVKGEKNLEIGSKVLMQILFDWVATLSTSLNFFFYFRAKTFANAFRNKWSRRFRK